MTTKVATTENVQGSMVETPQIWLAIKRITALLTANPATVPATIKDKPFLSTIRRTSLR